MFPPRPGGGPGAVRAARGGTRRAGTPGLVSSLPRRRPVPPLCPTLHGSVGQKLHVSVQLPAKKFSSRHRIMPKGYTLPPALRSPFRRAARTSFPPGGGPIGTAAAAGADPVLPASPAPSLPLWGKPAERPQGRHALPLWKGYHFWGEKFSALVARFRATFPYTPGGSVGTSPGRAFGRLRPPRRRLRRRAGTGGNVPAPAGS